MTGKEVITITITDFDNDLRYSTFYILATANNSKMTKEEFHNMQLDRLIENFEEFKKNVIKQNETLSAP